MAIPQAKLEILQTKHTKQETIQHIQKYADTLKQTIESISKTLENPEQDTYQWLDEKLMVISHFFRDGKFSTFVLPVLEQLATIDSDLWRAARYAKWWNPEEQTNMPITPKFFENLPKSTAELRDDYWEITNPTVRVRELVLLSVYEITMEKLWAAFYSVKR